MMKLNAAARGVADAVEAWLDERGCKGLLPPGAVEAYAATAARLAEADAALSKDGLIGKHPTTGAACPSPTARIFNDVAKLCFMQWQGIQAAVQKAGGQMEPEEQSEMEKILRRVK